MNKIFDLLNTHKEMIITTIISIAAPFIPIIYGKYFKNQKALYIHQSTHLKYSNKKMKLPENTKVFYNEEAVDKIYRSVIRIWNCGDKVLKKKLIPTKFPLQISTQNTGKILDTKVLGISGKACEIKMHKIKEKSFNIIFDFLNTNDGIFIELFHTAPLKKIEWEMKGVKIKPVRFLNVYSGMPILYKILIISYGLYVIWMLGLSVLELHYSKQVGDGVFVVIYSLILLTYVFGVFIFKRVPKSLLISKKTNTPS